ncbi:MAG: hypothetical protein ACP6IP_09370 [Candidatus Njordarchaeia archaeon]
MQKGTSLGESIKNALFEIMGSGANGVALINPEGFVIESVGNLSSRDEGLSSVFAIAFPKIVSYINEQMVKNIGKLLGEKVNMSEVHMTEFSYELSDRTFLGLYIDGYLLVAGLKSKEAFESVHRSLISVISRIIDLFAELSGKKPILPLAVAISKQPITPEARSQAPLKIKSEKKLEDLRFYLLRIRELVFDMKKNLIEHGDWYTALQDFKKLRSELEKLTTIDEDIASHPAIKAIQNWVGKTISRIELILDARGNEVIDEERKNVLRRGLSKAIEYIRFVIGKETENK